MSFISIGDQSRLFLERRQNAMLKAEMQRLTQELSTGKLVRPATRTTGDTVQLLGLERAQTRLEAHRTATTEAGHFVDVAQAALEVADTLAQDLGPGLLTASSSAHASILESVASDAKTKFRALVSAFNTRAAERAVFSGTATSTNPLADADAMLADLRTAIAGETTATGIEAIVSDWFAAPGGGFETMGYQGGTTATMTFRVGDQEDVTLSARADDPVFRNMLKGFALAALISGPDLTGNVAQQVALAEVAGTEVINAGTRLSDLRAEVGSQQARSEDRSVRHAGERSARQLAEAKFTAADPSDTATALEQVQNMLETLYTLTARQSRLNLAEYLR
jgi:flagellar hook-associated protein 3 FlgL